MIIYRNDSVLQSANGSLVEMTPAHRFVGVEFDTILREIDCGNIPTNTGEPFPVNWEDDNSTDYQNNGDFNPWKNL